MTANPAAGFLWRPLATAFDAIFQREEAILTFLPSCLVFLLTPSLFIRGPSQPVRLLRGWLLRLKLLCATSLIFLEVASILPRATSIDFNAKREFPIFTIDLIIAASVAGALYQEYRRAMQASVFLGLHLAAGLVIDITKSRAYFRDSDIYAVGYLSATSAAVRLVLLVLNEMPRGAALIDDRLRKPASKESSSGFWGRALFLWLNSTLLLGFRTQIRLDDLDELGPEFSSEMLSRKFKDHWLGAENDSHRSLAIASYHHTSSRLMTQFRGILVAEVLDKSHSLSQSESSNAAALTLMSKDVEGVASGVMRLYEIPFNILEAALGMSCLALFVGKACLMILLPLSFSIIFGTCIGNYTAAAMVLWNEKIQHRVSKTSKVLSQMRVIKMLGLGPTISVYLQRLREEEIATSRSHQAYKTITLASQMFVATITPVLVVSAAFYWTFMGKLSAAEVFPSLAAVAIVQRPLYTLVSASSRVTAMFACLSRIQKYLELEEDMDQRILVGPLLNSDEENEIGGYEAISSTAIEFIDVTLLSHDSESEILQQANFALERGSITAALGPSGSGKSALLNSLVGDANVADGFIYVDDKVIGYADQSPWIRNVSIRANIVGELAFDAFWYSTILRVCMLLEDLEHLPDGDKYVAGTNGMNLSGGQRQRISLARALYCRAKTLVLDNIFSALDRKTAVSILLQLCGEKGLLRKAGCTVVIATYLPESLEVADQLLLLDGKGGITLEKDFREEWFQAHLVEALSHQTTTAMSETEDKEKAAIQRSREFQELAGLSAIGAPLPNRGLNPSMYTFFINSSGRSAFAAWVFSVFLVSFGESIPDVFIRVWVSAAPESVAYFAAYVGASVFATLACAASFGILFYVLTPRSSAGLHDGLTHVVMHSTLAFFSCADTGSILNRYSGDMNSIIQELPQQAYRFLYMMFHIILQTVIIGSGTTYMVTVLPVIVVIAGVLLYCFVQTSRQVYTMQKEAETPLYNHFTETASGLRHIKAMGWQLRNFKVGLALLDISQKTVYTASCLKGWLGLAVNMLACGVCHVLTSLSLERRTTTPVPAIGLSYLILITLGRSLGAFFDSWADLDSSVKALSRLREFMENTPMEPELHHIDLPARWPHRGQIDLRNVTAKYRRNTPARLEDVSLRVVPGNKVGITGPSGSGKSSLFMSILGFLEYSGKIEIDGIDISKIPRDTLRSRITTISQDHLDLGGTVRNNLLPFNMNVSGSSGTITDEEIMNVLDSVGLRARVDYQGGLDAPLSKVGLSHGQLQLLSIARAILRGKETESKVVLMDEATSNVDLETDAKIQQVLRESFAECTILMIAHRLETIRDADMFVELAHGKATIVKN
ncbi:ABC transporter, transmembrane domain, type 1 [Akanthomyces lecanii RCEF 1005]|uniref:ABC transporter, transmembrane domain, type 1 n=1 Tax=Akanthomyces lecanii RCEF 1005 TaxID=1081108 RepID=A0A162IV45_CORDF|nr:ABC transporter, transmembrane domain, type 1 [Akanthomyces lecanii RCEF 1005]